MPTKAQIMTVMNNMKKSYILVLSCFCFISLAQAQHVDQSPVELDNVSNLLKWSDLIVVAKREEYEDSIQVEKCILNKRENLDLNSSIIINTLVKQVHVPPVVMDGYRYLFFLTVFDAKTGSAETEGKTICKITGEGTASSPSLIWTNCKAIPEYYGINASCLNMI